MRKLVLFALLSLPSSGAISIVQAPAAVLCATVQNCQITFSSNVTSGNVIVFSATVSYGGTWGNTTLADSRSTPYTKVFRTRHGTQTDHYLETWWGCASTTGANTVTYTSPNTMSYARITAIEYSGIDCANAVDQTRAASGTGTAVSTGAVTTTQTNELLYVAASKYNSAPTWTAGANFTIRADSNIPSPSRDGVMAEDWIVSSAGEYTGTATLSASSSWNVHIVTFKAGGTPPPTTIRKRVMVVTR